MGSFGEQMLVVLLLLFLPQDSSSVFLNFKKGVDYKYRIDTESTLAKVDTPFNVGAQVSFQHVEDTETGQVCLLTVHSMIWHHGTESAIATQHYDFSQWFSFEISGRGEITRVWYPPQEVIEVINIKKGIVSFLAAKLHHNHEVGRPNDDKWNYVTNETGHEGEHEALYSAEPHEDGLKFTKIRQGHPVMGLDPDDSRMHKEIYFKHDGDVPHRVLIKEKVTSARKSRPGFDVHEGTRGTHFVNEQEKVDLPEMSTNAESEFTLIGLRHTEPVTPPPELLEDTIHATQHRTWTPQGPQLNLTYAQDLIRQDVVCLRKLVIKRAHPKKDVLPCYTSLKNTLSKLSNEDLLTVVDSYFNQPNLATKRIDRAHLMDAVSDLHTDFTEDLIMDYVFLSDRPDKMIIERILVHYVGTDVLPPKRLVDFLESVSFYPEIYDGVWVLYF
ncbi:uncharacterized protein LOC118406509 [Branchiostoma floridae]|uniref:Uncharacterized protein LOC118406509 n=1 Tax=Branchiostoma floridae TaxID=7739 RepID=A0A9J7HN40_BRAFL|nr:uncharacterized protein LOC118406509 [Branchiostoma floridae]